MRRLVEDAAFGRPFCFSVPRKFFAMTNLSVEPYGLACTDEGVFIWPGVPLVEKRGVSFARVSERDIANTAGVLFGPDVLHGPLIPTLERAARFLERGQLGAAQEIIANLPLPPLTTFGQHLTRVASGVFDPDKHPRWPAGSPDRTGGEFRPAEADDAPDDTSESTQTAAAGTLNQCIESCYHLLDRWQPPGQFHKNEWDFQRCLAECRGKFS